MDKVRTAGQPTPPQNKPETYTVVTAAERQMPSAAPNDSLKKGTAAKTADSCAPNVSLTPPPLSNLLVQCAARLCQGQYQDVLNTLSPLKHTPAATLESCQYQQQVLIATLALQSQQPADEAASAATCAQLEQLSSLALECLISADQDTAIELETLCRNLSGHFHAGIYAKARGACELLKGVGCWQDTKRSKQHFRTSARSEHPGGQFILGLLCIKDGQTEDALRHMKTAHENGFAPAQKHYAALLCNKARIMLDSLNSHTPKNTVETKKARIEEILCHAATLGEPAGLAVLSMAYYQGRHCFPVNPARAQLYLDQGVALDCPAAKLGKAMMLSGWSNEDSSPDAVNVLARNMRPDTSARLYRDIREDLKQQAQEWGNPSPFYKTLISQLPAAQSVQVVKSFCSTIRSASTHRFKRTVYFTGTTRLQGELWSLFGIPESGQEEAVRHKLLMSHQADALYWVGISYAYGIGVEKDYEQARRLMYRALNQGFAPAAIILGALTSTTSATHPVDTLRKNRYHDRAIAMRMHGAINTLMMNKVHNGQVEDGCQVFHHLEEECNHRESDEDFEYHVVAHSSGFETSTQLKELAKQGSLRARLLLARQHLGDGKHQAALSHLKQKPQLVVPEAELLQQIIDMQPLLTLPPLQQMDFHCVFRALDLHLNFHKPLANASLEQLGQQLIRKGDERLARSLALEPGKEQVCKYLAAQAAHSTNLQTRTQYLQLAYWISRKRKYITPLTTSYTNAAQPDKARYLEQQYQRETSPTRARDKWTNQFQATEQDRKKLIAACSSDMEESIKELSLSGLQELMIKLSFFDTDKKLPAIGCQTNCFTRKSYGLKSDTRPAWSIEAVQKELQGINFTFPECNISASTLQTRKSLLSTIAGDILPHPEITRLQPQLCGELCFKLALCCHYLDEPDAAGDYLYMAADYGYKPAYFPAAVYALDRHDTDNFQIWLNAAPVNQKTTAWKKEIHVLALNHKWNQLKKDDEEWQKRLELSEQIACAGHINHFSRMAMKLLETLEQCKNRAAQRSLARTYQKTIHRALASGSSAFLPLIMTQMMVGPEHKFFVSPLALMTALKNISPLPVTSGSLLHPEHRKQRMINCCQHGPWDSSYDVFQASLKIIGDVNTDDTRTFAAVLAKLGFIKDQAVCAKYTSPTTPNRGLQDAMIQIYRGNHQKAAHIIDEGRGSHGKVDGSLLLLCQLQVFKDTSRKPTLEKDLETLVRNGYSAANTCLAVLALRQGNRQKAIEHLTPLLAHGAPDPEGLCLLGFLSSTDKEAIQKQAADLNSPPALCQQAAVLIRQGHITEATKLLQSPWIRRDPEAAAMLAYLKGDTPENMMTAAAGSPRAIFRLNILKLSGSPNHPHLDSDILLQQLAQCESNEDSHILSVHPDMQTLLLHLDIREIEAGISPQDATHQLINSLKILKTRWGNTGTDSSPPTEASHASYQRLLERVLNGDITAETEKNILHLERMSPDSLTQQQCHMVATRFPKNTPCECQRALYWLKRSVPDAEYAQRIVRETAEVMSRDPVPALWLSILREEAKDKKIVVNISAEQIQKAVTQLSKTKVVPCPLIHDLITLGSDTASGFCTNLPVPLLSHLLDQCLAGQRSPSKDALSHLLVHALESKTLSATEPDLLIPCKETMVAYYLDSQPSKCTKALQWLTLGCNTQVDQEEYVLTKALENEFRCQPLKQQWLLTLIQQLQRTLAKQQKTKPPVFSGQLLVAINQAALTRQYKLQEDLSKLLSSKTLAQSPGLTPEACFHQVRITLNRKGLEKGAEVVKAILTPTLQHEQHYQRTITLLMTGLLVKPVQLPQTFLIPCLQYIQEAHAPGSSSQYPQATTGILSHLPEQLQQHLCQALLATSEGQKLFMALLNETTSTRCLAKASCKQLDNLYWVNADQKDDQPQAKNNIKQVLLQKHSFELHHASPALLKEILKETLDNMPINAEWLVILLRALLDISPDEAVSLLEALQSNAHKIPESHKALFTNLMAEIKARKELAENKPEEILATIFEKSNALCKAAETIRSLEVLEQTNYHNLLSRMKFWMRQSSLLNMQDKTILLKEQCKRLENCKEAVLLREKMDTWEQEPSNGARYTQIMALKKLYPSTLHMMQLPLSKSDQQYLNKIYTYPDTYTAAIKSLCQKEITPADNEQWQQTCKEFRDIPTDHPLYQKAVEAVSVQYSNHVEKKIKTFRKQLTRQMAAPLPNPEQLRDTLEELAKSRKTDTPGITLKLKASAELDRLEEQFEECCEAAAFIQQLQKLSAMSSDDRHQLRIADIDGFKDEFRKYQREHNAAGVTTPVLALARKMECLLDFELLRREFQDNTCSAPDNPLQLQCAPEQCLLYFHYQQLVEHPAYKQLMEEIPADAINFLHPLALIIERYHLEPDAKKRFTVCDQIHSHVVQLSNHQDQMVAHLAEFNQRHGKQEQANIQWGRLTQSSDPSISAKIPRHLHLQSKITQFSAKIHRIKPGDRIPEDVTRLAQELKDCQEEGLSPLMERYRSLVDGRELSESDRSPGSSAHTPNSSSMTEWSTAPSQTTELHGSRRQKKRKSKRTDVKPAPIDASQLLGFYHDTSPTHKEEKAFKKHTKPAHNTTESTWASVLQQDSGAGYDIWEQEQLLALQSLTASNPIGTTSPTKAITSPDEAIALLQECCQNVTDNHLLRIQNMPTEVLTDAGTPQRLIIAGLLQQCLIAIEKSGICNMATLNAVNNIFLCQQALAIADQECAELLARAAELNKS